MTVDGVVMVGCEVVGVGLMNLGVLDISWTLDISFGVFFCLKLDGVEEWTSGGVVRMVGVTGGF